MNLILLEADDFLPGGDRVSLKGRRAAYLRDVHRLQMGGERAVGVLGGRIGCGRVVALAADAVELEVVLDRDPPAPLPLTLLLALPRPKVLHRIVQGVAAMGVKRIFLMNAWRVEKSYWSSPALLQDSLANDLRLGLEQGCDTILPTVSLKPLFRPFVEDEVPALTIGTRALLADPQGAERCPAAIEGAVSLAVGPEGGFTPFERDLLASVGFTAVSLGSRQLRVEQAVAALIGRLCP